MAPHVLRTSQGTPIPTTQQLAALYARVSTTDQADKGYSLPTQIEACLVLARQEGYCVPETHIFVDDYTGTTLNRPQLAHLRELVRQRLVHAVLVHDTDRLSRKLAHQLLLDDEFEHAGVRLLCVTMPTSDKTPETQLLSNVRGIIAEYERAKILERTARGRVGRVKAGYTPGGRRALGYVRVLNADKGAHFEVHPEEAALVQRIFRLYVIEGLSQEAIAALLTQESVLTPGDLRPGLRRELAARVWHQSTVSSILHNTAYVGTLYYNKKTRIPGKQNPDKKTRWQGVPQDAWIPVAVPPIIDVETFATAQVRLKMNAQQSRRNRQQDYLFVSGRFRCGQCGCAMTGETNPGRQARYRCSRGKRTYQDVAAPHGLRSVLASVIEPVVWQAIERVLNSPALITVELERRKEGTSGRQADLDRERQQYERQLAQCDKELKRWEAAYLGEAIDLDDFKGKKAEVDTRRASVERELTRMDDQQRCIEQTELETTSLMEYCARVRSQLQHFTLEEKRRALEALNITATWHPEHPLAMQGSIPVGIVNNALD